jgi:integrase
MNHELTFPIVDVLAAVGQVANVSAMRNEFDEYRKTKAPHTLRRQSGDLKRFADYIQCLSEQTTSASTAAGLRQSATLFRQFAESLTITDHPVAAASIWSGLTFGLVKGYRQWMLDRGDAVTSVNVRLSTLRTYSKLAFKTGLISHDEYLKIRDVQGYARKEQKHLDEQRTDAAIATRRGHKKVSANLIPLKAVKALKAQNTGTPQGRRDAVLMCLLLDHALRCGEVAALKVSDVSPDCRYLTFYRPKVDRVDTHLLTEDAHRALKAWFESGDAPVMQDAPLLRGSRKGGQLTSAGLSERAITKRVRDLGRSVGIENLSAHDCRHTALTYASRNGAKEFRLQEYGGWSSLAMARRYVKAAEIANEGIVPN